MQQIEVYLDHNAQLELVGRLTYEQLRGNATYHFSYDANWLSNHPHLSLSGDLQLHTGYDGRLLSWQKPQQDPSRMPAAPYHR